MKDDPAQDHPCVVRNLSVTALMQAPSCPDPGLKFSSSRRIKDVFTACSETSSLSHIHCQGPRKYVTGDLARWRHRTYLQYVDSVGLLSVLGRKA